jgi:hypothetical protein
MEACPALGQLKKRAPTRRIWPSFARFLRDCDAIGHPIIIENYWKLVA